MLAGVAEEASLAPFYPDGNRPGIRRPYVHLADCRVRLANIYVGRPRTLAHQEFLQTGFSHRKAKDWRNVLGLAWSFFSRPGGWQAAWLVLHVLGAPLDGGFDDWAHRPGPGQQAEIERQRSHEAVRLPDDFDYRQVRGLSAEVCEKFLRHRPATLGQAGRIPGVTPAALSLLLIHLRRKSA